MGPGFCGLGFGFRVLWFTVLWVWGFVVWSLVSLWFRVFCGLGLCGLEFVV